jgi:hypothetical protein
MNEKRAIRRLLILMSIFHISGKILPLNRLHHLKTKSGSHQKKLRLSGQLSKKIVSQNYRHLSSIILTNLLRFIYIASVCFFRFRFLFFYCLVTKIYFFNRTTVVQ